MKTSFSINAMGQKEIVPTIDQLTLLFTALLILIGAPSTKGQTVPVAVPTIEKSGLLTEEIDGEGNVSLHLYDDTSSLDVVVLPEGLSRAFESSQAAALPPAGMATSEQNPAPALGPQPVATFSEMSSVDSRDTVFVLGPDGKIVEAREGDVVTTLERDANGQITQLGLPSGHTFDLAYDERGNLVAVTDDTHGNTATLAYHPQFDLVTEAVYPGGAAYRANYDSIGNLIEIATPEGREINANYDEDGLLTSYNDPLDTLSFFDYDASGNLSSVRIGEGVDQREMDLNNDSAGRLMQLDLPEGRSLAFNYHGSGVPQSITESDGALTTFQEDGNGDITSLVRPGDANHAFTYDGLQRVAGYTPPGQPAIQYDYNVYSDPLAINVGGQERAAFEWNDRGQITSTIEQAATPHSTIYVYDDVTANLLSASSGDGITLTPTYSGEFTTGLAWSGSVSGSVDTTFDDRYRIDSVKVGDETPIAYTYDDDNLLTSAGGLTITRDPNSGLVTAMDIGTISETFDYNAFGELAAQTATANGTEIFAAIYTRDKLGRVIQIVETVQGTTTTLVYTYDSAGRIASVTRDGTPTESYTYDPRGNLISDHLRSYTYNAADQVLTAGDATFSYTDTGERLTRSDGSGTTTYHYTVLSRLRGIDLSDGRSLAYQHDAADNRTAKAIDGTVVEAYLCLTRNVPAAIFDAAGTLQDSMVYAFSGQAPAYISRNGTNYRLVTDQLGSVRLVVNANTGEVTQALAYDAFGAITSDTAPGFQPFGFAGGWTDPDTGLVRFGARDYDPEARRWTTPDPILFASGSFNNYAYVDSDPINLVDLSGLGAEEVEETRTRVGRVLGIDGDGLSVIRKGQLIPASKGDPVFLGDQFTADKDTKATLEFAIGGQAVIMSDSAIKVISRDQVEAVGNRFLVKMGALWAKIDKSNEQIQIQTSSGTIGVEG